MTNHGPSNTLGGSRVSPYQGSRDLGIDFGLTSSCYDPPAVGLACGRCDACQLRLKGFPEAGMADPIRYADKIR
jgi:7-cyano-7-deazaguanine synthase